MNIVHIRLPAELKEKASKEAKRLNISLTDLVRVALVEKLER